MPYFYPDGRQCPGSPFPGELFMLPDGSVWMWDGAAEVWESYNVTTLGEGFSDYYDPAIEYPKCECGSHAVGSTRHSTLCQLFEEKM